MKNEKGKRWSYGILVCYDGFDYEKSHGDQDDSLYDIWQQEWIFFAMIYDYYQDNPDPKIKCYKKGEIDDEEEGDGGGKVGIDADSGDESEE